MTEEKKDQIKKLVEIARKYESEKKWQEAAENWAEIEKLSMEINWKDAINQAQRKQVDCLKNCEEKIKPVQNLNQTIESQSEQIQNDKNEIDPSISGIQIAKEKIEPVKSGAVTLSELGNSLKCKCGNFAKITREAVDDKTVQLDFECSKCSSKYQRKYSLNQFIRMAQAGLIDPPEIKEFQKKMIILKGELPRIDKGLDGAFIIDQQKRGLINSFGRAIICNCNKFFAVSVKKFKKDSVDLSLYCYKCAPKGKSLNVKVRDVLLAGKAGLLETDVMGQLREEYQAASQGFNTKDTYTSNDGTLAEWVQESLGMIGDAKTKKCYICGSSVSEGTSRCPKCGSDL